LGRDVRSSEEDRQKCALLDLPTDVLSSLNSTEIKPSVVEELLRIRDRQQQSDFARLAKERGLSSRKTRELVNEFQHNSIYDNVNVDSFYAVISDLDTKTQRSFDKSITVIRLAMNKLTSIMEMMEDNWIVYETLMDHRKALHERIDLLIKQKRKI
jgi:ParB family chromosome partitioning protein